MAVVVSRRALQLTIFLMFLVGAAYATAADRPVRDGRPMNIVLIVADDLRWDDLPMFGTPVVWEQQDDPLDLSAFPPDRATDKWGEYREANWRRPDLNRLAARIMANNPDGSLGSMTDEDPLVVPGDLDNGENDIIENTTAADFHYAVGASNHSRDVLSGFGGLGLLAREGVVMPRFYANSAKCAPSRAALLTGRHQQRADVLDNGKPLIPRYVTFAELLKQGCAEGDTHTCYHTGWFGKWNPGASKGNDPWRQGFDEYIGFENSKRKYFSTSAAYCSPVLSAEEDPATPRPTKFCQPPTGTTCDPTVENPDAACAAEPYGATTCSDHGVCFNPWPWPCKTSTECCTSEGCGVCRPAARYLGKRDWLACSATDASRSLDCCVPSNNEARRGRFNFTGRKVRLADATQQAVTFTRNACDVDDGPYEASALQPPGYESCLYLDRMVRDWARNFLIRRLYDDPDDRFLLVVAPKAPHMTLDAPDGTAAHYNTASLPIDRPGANDDGDYWALVEELDALVGTLVELIDGMCDASSGDLVGDACTSDANCGAGACVSRRDNTLILFTDDNGGAGKGWGQPDLAGAKETVWEGGIRVGLVARGPGVGVGLWTDGLTGWQSQRENATSSSIGSLVDIFPTIAQAAGYGLAANGSIDITTCSGDNRGELCHDNADCEGFCQHICRNTGTLCTTNDDCAGEECLQNSAKRCSNTGRSCQNDDACSPDCDPYPIDGRSLIPVLNGSAEGSAYEWERGYRAYRREFTYSTYINNPSLAVSGREGYFKQCDTSPEGDDGYGVLDTDEADACSLVTHVCAYDGPVLAPGAVTQESRHHHASSCIACKPGAAPGAPGSCASEDGVGNQRCEVIGRVCVPDDNLDPLCVDKSATGADLLDPGACGIPQARRCRDATDCPEHWTCSGEVAVKCQACSPAAWKALGGVGVVSHLFDLASNPEEDIKVNCSVVDGALGATRVALSQRLDNWQTCVTGQDEQNGENCHEPQ